MTDIATKLYKLTRYEFHFYHPLGVKEKVLSDQHQVCDTMKVYAKKRGRS